MKNLDVIRVLAVQRKMSLSDVAAKVGISPQGLNKIINTSNTTIPTLEKLAAVFNVPVGFFFDEVPGDYISVGDNSPGAGKENNVNVGMAEVMLRMLDEMAEQRKSTDAAVASIRELVETLKSKK